MAFGIDDALLVAGTLLGGLGSLGKSPQEMKAEEISQLLAENRDWLKSLPFSREEIMNQLLPTVQRLYRGAADVVAGRAGAGVGEAGLAGGQGISEYYLQTLAPIIAGGEQLAANAQTEFAQWFAQLDQQSKNRFLQAIQLELSTTGMLPDMNQFQRVITGALSGMNLGATAGGNLAMAGTLNDKSNTLNDIYNLLNQNQGIDILRDSGNILSNPNLIDGIYDPNRRQGVG